MLGFERIAGRPPVTMGSLEPHVELIKRLVVPPCAIARDTDPAVMTRVEGAWDHPTGTRPSIRSSSQPVATAPRSSTEISPVLWMSRMVRFSDMAQVLSHHGRGVFGQRVPEHTNGAARPVNQARHLTSGSPSELRLPHRRESQTPATRQ